MIPVWIPSYIYNTTKSILLNDDNIRAFAIILCDIVASGGEVKIQFRLGNINSFRPFIPLCRYRI